MTAGAIIAATAIAACGSSAAGSSSSTLTTSSGGHLTYAQAEQDAVNFSRCMRSHGVPSFPDPTDPRQFKQSLNPNLPHSPAFVSAAGACQHLLPNGGPQDRAQRLRTRVADMLAFARCMRARGFPTFPDPTNQGELSPAMVTAAGIDLHQPAVLRAALACQPVTHGLLTRAAIERAVNGG